MATVKLHSTFLQNLDLMVPIGNNIRSTLSREIIKQAKKQLEWKPKLSGWQEATKGNF